MNNYDKLINYNSILNIKPDDYDNNCDSNYSNYNENKTKKLIIPKNKGFMIIHEDFVMNGWDLITNRSDYLIYTKKENQCDEFIINIKSKNNIHVTIPILNSNNSYTTVFNNYFTACEFISMHIKLYEEKYINNYLTNK